MNPFLFCLLLLFLIRPAGAQPSQSSDMDQLVALNAKFIHNFVTNDTISHSKIIHPKFVSITTSGKYVSRKDYLMGWLHGFDGIVYWDYRDENIKLFGNTALVHAANKCIVISNGKEQTIFTLYTDVYVKEKGVWTCVQAQISLVDPAFFPSDQTIVRKYDYRK